MIYRNVLNKTKGLGKIIAELVDLLVQKGSKLENIHLIGHSLGAQACGFAGASLKSGKVARISGKHRLTLLVCIILIEISFVKDG